MTRADPKKVSRVAYVIGTFAGHPAVMGSMNAFLNWHQRPETAKMYVTMHERIDAFVAKANATFKEKGYPLELSNWFSVWSMMFTAPGRYHCAAAATPTLVLPPALTASRPWDVLRPGLRVRQR